MNQEKVLKAIHRIEELYFETDGKCYVSFSGGKDSTVLLALIKMSEESLVLPKNGIPAVFANTGIELDITYKFVNWCKDEWYENVVILRPKKSFGWVLKNKGKPMLSKVKSKYLNQWGRNRTKALYSLLIDGKTTVGTDSRKTKIANKDMHILHDDFDIVISNKCCDYLKKDPFKYYEKDNDVKGAITGVRLAEGGVRQIAYNTRAKNGGKLCTRTNNGIIYKMPIIDWTDDDVEAFIKEYNVPLSEAYTKHGMQRTGCMACPYSQNIKHDLEYLYNNEPLKYKASMFFLKDVYIAQNVVLPFDEEYEKERKKKWVNEYEPMRQEMLRKYRPNSRLIKNYDQLDIESYGL